MTALEEIRARAGAATPGEWLATSGTIYDPSNKLIADVYLSHRRENMDFIAHSRQDIPRLCKAVDVLLNEVERTHMPTTYEHIKKSIEQILRGKQ